LLRCCLAMTALIRFTISAFSSLVTIFLDRRRRSYSNTAVGPVIDSFGPHSSDRHSKDSLVRVVCNLLTFLKVLYFAICRNVESDLFFNSFNMSCLW
jgi:hypothetical protein